jgi:hypothetical protein
VPVGNVLGPLAYHELADQVPGSLGVRENPCREINPEGGLVRYRSLGIVLQSIESLIFSFARLVPWQRLDAERMQLLGTRGHDIFRLFVAGDPTSCLDVLNQSPVEGDQKVARVLASQCQADEPFPGQCEHFSDKVSQAVVASNVAEADAAVLLNLWADFLESSMEGGESIGGQFRERNFGHRDDLLGGPPRKAIRLKEPNRLWLAGGETRD